MIFQVAYDKCRDYYDQIPDDTFEKMAKSALYTFTATFLFSKRNPLEPYNLSRPLFAGGVAFLASFIYSITTPIFNMIFGDDELLVHREFIKQVVNITLSSAIIGYFTAAKVSLIALPLVGSLSINLIKSIIDLCPIVVEKWFKDKPLAKEIRLLFKDWKIDAPAGTGSVFINFGIFPALGLMK